MSSPSSFNATSGVFQLSEGHRIAVLFNGTIGTISTLSVLLLLAHIFSIAIMPSNQDINKEERVFLRMHLGVFVLCLLCSDFIQGISGIMQLYWGTHRHIFTGPLCTAQAAMLLFGDNGTAVWNSVVAAHTFWTVVLGRRMSTGAVAAIVAIGWTFCLVLVIIGPTLLETPERGPFYGIAGAWCFVTSKYAMERIMVHYLPMLLSALIITVLYILVALALFGVLVVTRNSWHFRWPFSRNRRSFWSNFSWDRLQRPSHTVSSSSNPSNPSAVNNGTAIRLGDVVKSIQGDGTTSIRQPEAAVQKDTSKHIAIQEDVKSHPFVGQTSDGPTRSVRGTVRGTGTGPSDPPQNKRGLALRTLALKMLWYPIVYIALVLPIAITRIDPTIYVSLDTMLAFMCLLFSMGFANVIIYITTRRLGPTPWKRRKRSMHQSRPSRTTNFTSAGGVQSVQIYVDQFTHRDGDDDILTDLDSDKVDLESQRRNASPDLSETKSPRASVAAAYYEAKSWPPPRRSLSEDQRTPSVEDWGRRRLADEGPEKIGSAL